MCRGWKKWGSDSLDETESSRSVKDITWNAWSWLYAKAQWCSKKKKSAINCSEKINIQHTPNFTNFSFNILHIWGRAGLNGLSQMSWERGWVLSVRTTISPARFKTAWQMKPCSEHLGLHAQLSMSPSLIVLTNFTPSYQENLGQELYMLKDSKWDTAALKTGLWQL